MFELLHLTPAYLWTALSRAFTLQFPRKNLIFNLEGPKGHRERRGYVYTYVEANLNFITYNIPRGIRDPYVLCVRIWQQLFLLCLLIPTGTASVSPGVGARPLLVQINIIPAVCTHSPTRLCSADRPINLEHEIKYIILIWFSTWRFVLTFAFHCA